MGKIFVLFLHFYPPPERSEGGGGSEKRGSLMVRGGYRALTRPSGVVCTSANSAHVFQDIQPKISGSDQDISRYVYF